MSWSTRMTLGGQKGKLEGVDRDRHDNISMNTYNKFKQ